MKLFNVHIDEITAREALDMLEERQIIFTPNPEILLEARTNKRFMRALKKGTMMLPDGHGLQFVSLIMRVKLKVLRYFLYLPALILFFIWKKPFSVVFPEIIHGSDFMAEMVAWASVRGKSVFFLGASDGVAKKVADFFVDRHPDLKVAGSSSLDPDCSFEAVKRAKPDVLFVAYGAPKQEIWIAEYYKKLPGTHMMGVGGSFDFWGGQIRRAPVWMRRVGLEWLWRLFLNPRQRLKRIWNAVVVFPLISFSS